jgi:hypothetical protein
LRVYLLLFMFTCLLIYIYIYILIYKYIILLVTHCINFAKKNGYKVVTEWLQSYMPEITLNHVNSEKHSENVAICKKY